MRPGDFSPGNAAGVPEQHVRQAVASMRPGDFSPGNVVLRDRVQRSMLAAASMRPGDFSPGNLSIAAS